MTKRSPSSMVPLTIATGLLAFPFAYCAAISKFGPEWGGLTRSQIYYTAVMFVATMLGAILDVYLSRKKRSFKIGASFIMIFIATLVIELMLLAAILPAH